jgi:hypothetical protein
MVGNGVNGHDAAQIVGLSARGPRATTTAAGAQADDAPGMLRNPIIICLTLAAIVAVAVVAEAVVAVTTSRRRIAW